MSKTERLRVLAKFIGLGVAHGILISLSNKPESVARLQSEVDHYDELSIKFAEGNWNSSDILEIKELACEECRKKLEGYSDLGEERFREIEVMIDEVLRRLEID